VVRGLWQVLEVPNFFPSSRDTFRIRIEEAQGYYDAYTKSHKSSQTTGLTLKKEVYLS